MMRTSRLIVLGVMAVALTAVAAAPASAADAAPAVVPDSGVVVYYFHGDTRCATCRKLEAYSEEAVRTGFAEQLASGAMSYQAVNIDQEPNKHFVQDFQLTNKAVVAVEYAGGKPVRHVNLTKVWQLVQSKEKFVTYVQDETRAFLDGA